MTEHALDGSRWITPRWKLPVAVAERAGEAPMPHAAADAELVQAVLDGDRDAFDLIVTRHQRTVYQLCYRYVGRHEDASELAQDVFVRAFRSLARFRGQSSLRTWLYRIAVNLSLNRVTAKRPIFEPLDAPHAREFPDVRVVGAERALLEEERTRRVRAAIANLPPRQRATLVLRVYQELPHEEIARVLGTSVGASKTNLFLALKKLKGLLS